MPHTPDLLFRALYAPRRLEILRLVWRREMTAGEISRTFPTITFGAVSQQLKRLQTAGLLDVRSEGRLRYYSARREAVGPVGSMLEQMWDSALYKLKLEAELEQGRRGPLPSKKRPSPTV